MRRFCHLTVILLLLNASSSGADRPNFPYEAVIDVENGEDVWSGPHLQKHYPTSHLQKGERVKVYRHDPGGWCMIAPPKGSYSWIRDINVRLDRENTGVIKENRIMVHVGSELNPDDFTTIQAELSKGDAIEILGKKTFSSPGEEIRTMYKIKPPKGEWRWIPRKSITPVGAVRNSPATEDDGPVARRGPIADKEEAQARPISNRNLLDADDSSPARDGKRSSEDTADIVSAKQKLAEIDKQFREMVRQEPPTWDLDAIEEKYRQLDAEVDQPPMKTEIGRRLDSIRRHRKVQSDYADFYKIISETKEKDSQLASGQPAIPKSPGAPTPLATPSQEPAASTPAANPLAKSPSFDGAGIVQRLSNAGQGGPQYVLIAPDGRLLSILQPTPGVDLSRWQNREVGVIGQRFHRDDWNVDVINVRSLQPVRLNRGTKGEG